MVSSLSFGTMIRTVGFISNYPPRQCGIAAFTTDLTASLLADDPTLDCFVVAMNDPGQQHEYPPRVRCEIAERDIESYNRAAVFLNASGADVVSVQHEYGIFGGAAGSDIVPLMQSLRMPIVTTLHTVLAEPSLAQRAVMDAMARLSERVVVMSSHGVTLLRDVYGIPIDKIDRIPHGVPRLPPAAGSKERLGLTDRLVILTFGLLGPDKGIEYVIDAMPAILARHPSAVYVVLGATHPHIRACHGEAYRTSLVQRARLLGVEDSVVFDGRFVTSAEIAEHLAAADVYVTPYLNPAQITSGTLAYAVGCGKAVISTPYSYARELLSNGRGVLVPWRDPAAIAQAANTLLSDVATADGLRTRAAAYGHDMTWPNVAQRYLESFARARVGPSPRLRTLFQPQSVGRRGMERPALNLKHLRNLTDSTGMLQHAVYDVPSYIEGYCLDDNARALLLTAHLAEAGTEDPAAVHALAARYLAFVRHAFDADTQRFRNFLSYPRTWVETAGSEDSHGRALWSLGTVVAKAHEPGRRSLAQSLFHAALPTVESFTSPRAWAYTLLGIDAYLQCLPGDAALESMRLTLATRLLELHKKASGPEWPWFEDKLTYCNARLSQALMLSGARLDDTTMLTVGLRSLEWLVYLQRDTRGLFSPIGSNGFYPQGGARAIFDQQPVEACAMVSACLDAGRVTGDPVWREHARLAFAWFLGHNHLRQHLYDPTTGGCRDGLHADRVNENQGAEATLSFLQASVEIRALDRAEMPRGAWAHEATP